MQEGEQGGASTPMTSTPELESDQVDNHYSPKDAGYHNQ